MPRVALSSGEVHYTEVGQGRVLVLLHANPGDSRDFEAVMPELSRHARVIAMDWPGYGQSPMPARPEERGASFFDEVLREFLVALGLTQVTLIGNSLGGHAAARLAASDPDRVRALVLVSPGGFTAHNLMTRAFCRLQGSRFALPPRWWARLYLRRRTQATDRMLQRAATVQSSQTGLMLNRSVWRSFAQPDHDLRRVATNIKAPTLLMFGQQDPAIPAHKDGKQARRCMPAAQFITLPCGHAPFAEMPEQFLAHVMPFLRASALA